MLWTFCIIHPSWCLRVKKDLLSKTKTKTLWRKNQMVTHIRLHQDRIPWKHLFKEREREREGKMNTTVEKVEKRSEACCQCRRKTYNESFHLVYPYKEHLIHTPILRSQFFHYHLQKKNKQDNKKCEMSVKWKRNCQKWWDFKEDVSVVWWNQESKNSIER
jgi:hypothetical protein